MISLFFCPLLKITEMVPVGRWQATAAAGLRELAPEAKPPS
jgi:hypothetical protein